MTTAEVAARLDQHKATINRWAKSGRLPQAAKVPGLRGARLFARSDVESLATLLGHSRRSQKRATA